MSKLSEEKPVELSTQEKMKLTLRRTSQLQTYLESVTIGALIFLGFAVVSGLFFLNVTLESGTLEALDECVPGPYFQEMCDKFTFFSDVDSEIIIATLFGAYKGIMASIIVTMILVSAVGIWLYIRGKSIKNDLSKITNDYTNQAYFFVLSTATHGKGEDIAMDFFDEVEDVFPELKREEIISFEKEGKEMEVEDIIIEDDEKKKKKEWRFNVVAKTKEGFFVVRYFTKDQVSYDDVRETLEIADKNFKTWTKGVFRLVCLAKSFSNDAIKNYESLDDKKIPVDLILVREKGFSFAKIGTEKLD